MLAVATALAWSVAALVPAVRDAAKDVPALWSPVSDWRPSTYVVPLALATAGALALGRTPSRWPVVVAIAIAGAWSVLLALQGLGSVQF